MSFRLSRAQENSVDFHFIPASAFTKTVLSPQNVTRTEVRFCTERLQMVGLCRAIISTTELSTQIPFVELIWAALSITLCNSLGHVRANPYHKAGVIPSGYKKKGKRRVQDFSLAIKKTKTNHHHPIYLLDHITTIQTSQDWDLQQKLVGLDISHLPVYTFQ